MRWTDPEHADEGALKIPHNWLYLHYYEALTVLFRIENALRMIVYIVLKDRYKGQWRTLTITSDDGNQNTIGAIAKKRVAQDQTFGYLGYPISSPLMHLTSGELIRIILQDSYWPMFNNYFPAGKEIVRTKLEEIGNVRNALAHFRPLKPDDVQAVKQNANQVLPRVEEALGSLVDCTDTVPTNTKDEWYNELKILSGPYCSSEFNQSTDGHWVQVGLKYSCPEVAEPDIGRLYRQDRVLSVSTPRILNASPSLLDNVIFAAEYVPFATIPKEGNPSFWKTIQFVFSRDTIAREHTSLKTEIESVIRTITTETDLIREDNLARGELVHAAAVTATRSREDGTWDTDPDELYAPLREDNPTEYWRGKPLFGRHFLTDAESYPWMPVGISRFSPPF